MRRDTRIQLIALGCMLGFLVASGVLATHISASVGRNRLVYADKAEAGDPPQVSLGIAMGAFRGLFVNYLWIRANDLKQDGKFYEAVDLAKSITKLQPRFPKVWQFHAWNLAYNISVSTNTPKERWNWVQSGIRLLRSEGVKWCPNDLGIQRELAWIHLHKVQGYMDDAHLYYKKRFAYEWSCVMGSPPQLKLEDMGTGKLKGMYIKRWLTPIVEAPDSLDELLSAKARPGETVDDAKKRVEETAALIAALKVEAGYDLDINLLTALEMVDARMRGMEGTGIIPPTLRDEPLVKLMGTHNPAVGKAIVNYTRRKVLTREYHMDPALMARYTETYGPLDWRHPAAHAVYWSHRGVEETLRRVNETNLKDFDVLNTDRLTIQAVQELFRSGDLTYDVLSPDFYLTLPNTEFIEVYRAALRDMVKRSKYEKDNSRPYRFFWAGYENFMSDAIRFLYRRGDKDLAAEYLKQLVADPDMNQNNPATRLALYSLPIDEWIKKAWEDDSREDSPTIALQEISGSLAAAYVGGLLRGDDKVFINSFHYAGVFHQEYQRSRAFETWVTKAAGGKGRMGFPPFPIYSSNVFAQLINGAGMVNGSTMYRRAPTDLQAYTYVFLERTPIKGTADAMHKSEPTFPAFDVWFPPPPQELRERALMEIQREMDESSKSGRSELK